MFNPTVAVDIPNVDGCSNAFLYPLMSDACAYAK